MDRLEKILSLLDSDEKSDLIRHMYDALGDEKVGKIIEDYVKEGLVCSREDTVERVIWALETYDDYICFECSIKGLSAEECITEEKASSMIAEKVFEEFFDRAELMVELGMRDEAIGYISAVAEGIRQCHIGKKAAITALAGDFPLRYADILESSFDSDDVLKGFGKK